MDKLAVIDGNSILNRAFYGIMGSKMLQTEDGTYTNAVYGFLNIVFKLIKDIEPEYLVVAFDLKAPTKRHKMYDGYKATRKGMPEELAMQMPIIKDVLKAMNIEVITKEGYEADDILGTLAKYAESEGLEVTLLTGDRDSFQLASDFTTIRIPRTKQGKTEIDNFNREKILETYGLEPKQLIDVKGLQGDTSDNIPGVPGIGEKTALNLIQTYESIDNLYAKLEAGEASVKGKQKENLENNKDLAYLSKELGTIDVDAPIEKDLNKFLLQEWNKEEVYNLFKKLRFSKFIERFELSGDNAKEVKNEEKFEIKEVSFLEISKEIINQKIFNYYLEKKESLNQSLPIKKEIKNIYISLGNVCNVVDFEENKDEIRKILENEEILKCGHDIKEDYILFKQYGINPVNMMFDSMIAGYVINSITNLYSLEALSNQYLSIDIDEFTKSLGGEKTEEQINLFDSLEPKDEKNYDVRCAIYAHIIEKLKAILEEEMKKSDSYKLFLEIEMPLVEVLAEMQLEGIYIDKKELVEFGDELKSRLEELRKSIYEKAGEEFNINSTKQLGEILFEKLKLTVIKKNKSGYSTDVEVLEKLKFEHPIIEDLLEYRQLTKLNSTYVEGMKPYINPKTKRIHSFFHQTITATGRISSSDPNLQNIPTRTEMGKMFRKVFKSVPGKCFIDADYSQIELRVLAHISKDESMIEAFNNEEDIHAWTASKVFEVPLEEVSKELRSKAKAVNFGIVYGISDFGLAEQLNISRKQAKQDIEQYLDKYYGIKQFMTDIVEEAKEKGYVETLFNRRRYIPELKSNNYMVRKFGDRVAMNTPIQGTAADIMKIAMINVYNELKNKGLKSRIVLQIHDELLIETLEEEKEIVQKLFKENMENVISLLVPLKVEEEIGYNWYEVK